MAVVGTATQLEARPTSYLIDLKLEGRLAVVVGFGAVGRRKAAGLLAASARVRAVDPTADPGEASDALEIAAECYGRSHLGGAALAFAAATPDVNRIVLEDCRKLGIWVNSATEPDEGEFTIPATWRDGPVTLAVSTGGSSPALAAVLRDRAGAVLGPAAAGLAGLLAELRPLALARILDPEARTRLLAAWGEAHRLSQWETEGSEAVRRDLLRLLDRAQSACGLPPDDAS